MHSGILSVGIENGGHWYWPSMSFWPFWLRTLGNLVARAISPHRFGLESPSLHQACIMGCSQLVLKMEVIDLYLQGHFGHFDLEFQEIWLVRAITCNRYDLESPNLRQICISVFSQLVLNLDLQGHLPISTEETAFDVALVYILRATKGCYTSQTCSCHFYFQGLGLVIFQLLSHQPAAQRSSNWTAKQLTGYIGSTIATGLYLCIVTTWQAYLQLISL